MKHQIHSGPNNGQYQMSKGQKRYLLADRKIKTGPREGKYQAEGKTKRYLLR
jgi:hypothetical protein